MSKRQLTDVEFTLEWKSTSATHTDTFFVSKVDLYQDKLPGNLANRIIELNVGESDSHTYSAKEILTEDYSSEKVIHFESNLFDQNFKGHNSPPILHRYYPSAIAHKGLNTDNSDYTPFRIISMNDEKIVADKNHPLSKYYLTLRSRKLNEYEYPQTLKKRKRDIGKLITSRGPGMQALFEYGDSVFFDKYPLESSSQQAPQKIKVDSLAAEQISKLYSENLAPFSKVLDLISDDNSYLDEEYKTGLLTGVGAQEASLSTNQRLDTYQIQDLNKHTLLDFEDNSFDDAICTLAFQQLVDPKSIMKEVARVVNSGGKFIVSFTDNGDSSNDIGLWRQLHPFERLQLVLEYFRQSELFTDIHTFSKRGVLRTSIEQETDNKKVSDPIYAVWAKVK